MNDIEEKRGRGRPRKGDGSDFRLDVRIGPQEKDMLEHMEIESEKSKSELVRKSLQFYYNFNYGRW